MDYKNLKTKNRQELEAIADYLEIFIEDKWDDKDLRMEIWETYTEKMD